jgi:uncharacterized delta-60 repeat protein
MNEVPRFGRIAGTLQRPFAYTVSALWLLGVITYSVAAPGGVDPSFNADVDSWVYSIAVQADGKILIGGGFTNVNGATRYCIARLNPDGGLDASFDAGTIVGRTNWLAPYHTNYSIIRSVRAIALQPDGKILIGGDFAGVADVNHSGIARLTPDGSLDRSFDPGAGISRISPPRSLPRVSALAIQPDAKILLVGDFDSVNGTNRHGIARLNTDGSLEPTLFDFAALGIYRGSQFDSLVVQTDGRIVIGGTFGDYSSLPGTYNNILRFNSDGRLDPDFDSRGVCFEVAALALQTDGKLLLGAGMVGSYDGQPCARIGRLDTNGVVDTTFSNGTDGEVNSIVVQSDGRILIASGFIQVKGANYGRIARFHANGNLDQGFTSTASLDGPPYGVATQADGKVLVGGSFTTANGTPRKYLARLFGDDLPRLTALTASAEGRVQLAGNAATNAHLRLECSANLSDWSPISEFVNTNGTFYCTDGDATDFTSRFYRAVWLP